jgi:hypothetical protein
MSFLGSVGKISRTWVSLGAVILGSESERNTSFMPISSMLFVARVDRPDCRTPDRWTFSGLGECSGRPLRFRTGSTSECRISESLELSSSSSSSSTSLSYSNDLTGICCLDERRVGSRPCLRFRLRFLPPLSESSLESSARLLLREAVRDGRPLPFPRVARACARLLMGLRLVEASSSCSSSSSSSSSDEEIPMVEKSTKPACLAFEPRWRSCILSFSLCEAWASSSGWNFCSASGPPGRLRSSSKFIYS